MNNRKIMSILIVGFLSIACIGYASSQKDNTSPVKDLLKSDTFQKTKEEKDINLAFEKDLPNIKKIIEKHPEIIEPEILQKSIKNDIEVALPEKMGNKYKVYLISKNFIEDFKISKNFENIISDDFIWEIPLLDENNQIVSTSMAAKMNNDSWQVVRTGLDIPSDIVEIVSNEEYLEDAIKNLDIKVPKVIKHVRIFSKNMDFIFVKDENNKEFLIPMSFRENETGLSNMQSYEAENVIEVLSNL